MSIIFGPVASRRFGRSLGVDLSPEKKQCNFDCLYCELKPENVVDSYERVLDYREILTAIYEALNKHKNIDVLTFTANGEPTLYPDLKRVLDGVEQINPDIKKLILSNSSTIYKPETQKVLKRFDSVKLSLDCLSKRCFKRLDRASKSVDIEQIKEGIIEFSQDFKGELIIEILVVDGINDKPEEISKIANFLQKIEPFRVDLGTIDRPPAYDVKGVSYQRLFELSLLFDSRISLHIIKRESKGSTHKSSYSQEEILATLKRRPLTKDDILALFDQDSIKRFESLLNSGAVTTKRSGGVEFFEVR